MIETQQSKMQGSSYSFIMLEFYKQDWTWNPNHILLLDLFWRFLYMKPDYHYYRHHSFMSFPRFEFYERSFFGGLQT